MNAREGSRYGHVVRPGPFRRSRAYWLDGAVLHWRIGRRKGHLALADIVAMRLDARGAGADATESCVLTNRDGRRLVIRDVHWFGWQADERTRLGRREIRRATFRGLVGALARRVTKTGRNVRFETGPSRAEWLASCTVAACAVAVVVIGLATMFWRGAMSWPVLGFMALILVNLPLLMPVIRSGGPRRVERIARTEEPGHGA